MTVGLRTIAAGLSLAALLVAGHAGAQRVPYEYGRRADPLLAPRFKVFEIDWRQQLVERGLLEYAPRELAGPSVDDLTGELVVATRDGVVRLLTSTGREIWQTSLDATPTNAPLLTDTAIFIGGSDGSVHALARFDGVEMWSSFLGAAVVEKPTASGGTVFVGTDQDAVHALDEETGEVKWIYRRDTAQALSIRGGTGVGQGDGRIYAGFSDGAVVALSPEDGRILWQSPLAAGGLDKFPDSDAAPVYADGTVYVTVYNEGTYALDAATGKVRWQADTRGANSLTLDGDLVIVGGASAWALHAGSGALAWSVDLRRGWTSKPMVVKKMVVLAGSPGMLFVERDTGKPLRVFDPGSAFASPPAVRGGNIYALSNLGYFYALRTTLR